MRRLKLTVAVVLGCVSMALMPTAALALSPVTNDCRANNGLKGHYSVQQLQRALRTMPSSIAEYSNCQQIITDQLNNQLAAKPHRGGQGSDDSSGGGSSSSGLIILVIVVVVLIVTGGGFLYSRRRMGDGDSEDPPPPGA
jgi:hypothetical protein